MPLPPLNAVKAFEAAGRLENFSKAALELNVTPSAISRQIKNLEAHLGVGLFARAGNEVRITAAGRLYLNYVNEAFAKLAAGTRAISADHAGQPLHIWGSRFFIRLWLLPRLPDFHLQFPDQEVLITTVLPILRCLRKSTWRSCPAMAAGIQCGRTCCSGACWCRSAAPVI